MPGSILKLLKKNSKNVWIYTIIYNRSLLCLNVGLIVMLLGTAVSLSARTKLYKQAPVACSTVVTKQASSIVTLK